MFENLTERLQRVFKNLRGEGMLTEENIQEALRDIRMSLLEADVHFKVVKQLIDQMKAKLVGEHVWTELTPAQQVVKIVHDELTDMLGGAGTPDLKYSSQPPTVVLMAGLQGSGKTTTSGKLGRWLTRNGHRPLLVSVDVYRPAAREQLKIIAKQLGLPIYEGAPGEKDPIELARQARREAVNSGRDVLIVDTAGRLHIDDELMREMQ